MLEVRLEKKYSNVNISVNWKRKPVQSSKVNTFFMEDNKKSGKNTSKYL